MRVTIRIGARALILDRSDDAEHAGSVSAINAETVGALEQREWFRLLVTPVAGLGGFVDRAAYLGRQRGIADDSFGVENANAYNAGLVGHVGHHFVKAVAVV